MPHVKKQRNNGHHPVPTADATAPQRHDVEFVLGRTGVEHVYVCGDFNNWQPTSLRMIGHPDARKNVPNPHGSLNSVVEVRP